MNLFYLYKVKKISGEGKTPYDYVTSYEKQTSENTVRGII